MELREGSIKSIYIYIYFFFPPLSQVLSRETLGTLIEQKRNLNQTHREGPLDRDQCPLKCIALGDGSR